jgi:hypothetical protein
MERERGIVTGVLLLVLAVWLGFVLHLSPRFAGSGWGGALGIGAAVLMLTPLAYTLAKRVAWVNQRVRARRGLALLLSVHVYAGVVGAFLAILHTGHRFDSWLGMLLTATMLLSILSGYAGRHFLRFITLDLRARSEALAALQSRYRALMQLRQLASPQPPAGGLRAYLAGLIAPQEQAAGAGLDTLHLRRVASAIADLEYAISADNAIRQQLRRWLLVHIWTSVAFYALLLLHIGAGIQYGLRWFP